MKNSEITLGSLARMDWKRIYTLAWHLDIEEAEREKHGAHYWNERSKTMYEGEQYFSARALAFLKFARIPRGASVLDIASGVGALSVPLLANECKVTAVDISDYALGELKKNSPGGGRNLKIINDYFRNAADGLERYDYVINFYSLGVVCLDKDGKTDLSDALLKMNRLARKKVIITMPANEEKDIKSVHSNSYYWILYGALLSLGIVPQLKFKWYHDTGTLGYIYWKPVKNIG